MLRWARSCAFVFFFTSLSAAPFVSANTIFVDESFTIGTSATAPLPSGWKADKQSTVRTVGTYSAAVTATEQRAGTGMATNATNGIYNYAAGQPTSNLERAVGFISSSTATKSGNLYVNFTTGAQTSTSLDISYDVEKYRNGDNAAGFSFQMYYSLDGTIWTSAGADFLTSFVRDGNTSGFSPPPGVTVPVSKTLNVPVAANTPFYLAWNYSVTSGTATANAQALGIDNVKISGIAPAAVPLPSTASAGGAIMLGLGAVRTVRRRLFAARPI